MQGFAPIPVKRGLMFVDPHGETVEELARLKCMQEGMVLIDPRTHSGMTPGHSIRTPIINPFDTSFNTLHELHMYANALSDAFVSMISKDEEGLTQNMRTFLTPCITVLLMRGGSTFHDLRRFLSGKNIADLLHVA